MVPRITACPISTAKDSMESKSVRQLALSHYKHAGWRLSPSRKPNLAEFLKIVGPSLGEWHREFILELGEIE